MMRLKKRQRIDRLQSEVRPRRSRVLARNIYLATLMFLALWMFDFVAGHLFYLQAEGMTTRDMSVVMPEYTGTVQRVLVERGDRVVVGQPIAHLRSREMLRDIVRSSTQLADLQAQLSEMRIRQGSLKVLIPAAKAQVKNSLQERDSLITLARSGLVTNRERSKATTEAFRALEDLKRLETGSRLIETEFVQVSKSVDRAVRALDEIEDIYRSGEFSAAVAGIVGTISVTTGSVVKEGAPMIEVFHGEPYVLAYLPVGSLYEVDVGDSVSLRYGFHSLEGKVEAILPLAHRLPQEFQKTFDTAQREQLVRITISENATFPPLFTKVSISWNWTPLAALARVVTALSARTQ